MRNEIEYYYDLIPENIHQQNNNYKFSSENKNYILFECKINSEEIYEKYEIQKYLKKIHIECNEIIHNNMNQLTTKIYEKKYILIELKIKTRTINLKDLSFVANINFDKKYMRRLDRTNWKKMWSKKNDYIEYQARNNNNKYIRESYQYYIGIVENCIAMLESMQTMVNNTVISHERINHKMTTDDFYNPTNFILDNKVRDIAEYIKSYLYDDVDSINTIKSVLENFFQAQRLNKEEIQILYIRILYPSQYFDIYENIMENNSKEKELLKIINNSQRIEKNIKEIHNVLIKKNYIPNIEWLQ